MRKQCVPGSFFSAHARESLGTRLAGYGTKTIVIGMSLSEPHTSELNGGIFIYYIWVIPCQINTKKYLTLTDLDETWFLHSVC